MYGVNQCQENIVKNVWKTWDDVRTGCKRRLHQGQQCSIASKLPQSLLLLYCSSYRMEVISAGFIEQVQLFQRDYIKKILVR